MPETHSFTEYLRALGVAKTPEINDPGGHGLQVGESVLHDTAQTTKVQMWDANLPVEHQDLLCVRSGGEDLIGLCHSWMVGERRQKRMTPRSRFQISVVD